MIEFWKALRETNQTLVCSPVLSAEERLWASVRSDVLDGYIEREEAVAQSGACVISLRDYVANRVNLR